MATHKSERTDRVGPGAHPQGRPRARRVLQRRACGSERALACPSGVAANALRRRNPPEGIGERPGMEPVACHGRSHVQFRRGIQTEVFNDCSNRLETGFLAGPVQPQCFGRSADGPSLPCRVWPLSAGAARDGATAGPIPRRWSRDHCCGAYMVPVPSHTLRSGNELTLHESCQKPAVKETRHAAMLA